MRFGKGCGLNPKHIQSFNSKKVSEHFEQLAQTVKEFEIPLENIYNWNEKGVQLGGGFRTISYLGGCYTLCNPVLEL